MFRHEKHLRLPPQQQVGLKLLLPPDRRQPEPVLQRVIVERLGGGDHPPQLRLPHMEPERIRHRLGAHGLLAWQSEARLHHAGTRRVKEPLATAAGPAQWPLLDPKVEEVGAVQPPTLARIAAASAASTALRSRPVVPSGTRSQRRSQDDVVRLRPSRPRRPRRMTGSGAAVVPNGPTGAGRAHTATTAEKAAPGGRASVTADAS